MRWAAETAKLVSCAFLLSASPTGLYTAHFPVRCSFHRARYDRELPKGKSYSYIAGCSNERPAGRMGAALFLAARHHAVALCGTKAPYIFQDRRTYNNPPGERYRYVSRMLVPAPVHEHWQTRDVWNVSFQTQTLPDILFNSRPPSFNPFFLSFCLRTCVTKFRDYGSMSTLSYSISSRKVGKLVCTAPYLICTMYVPSARFLAYQASWHGKSRDFSA